MIAIRSGRRRRERGSLAIELVILTPLLIIFMMVLAGLGRFIEAQGQIAGAARDAARAASISQNNAATALQNAQDAADADLEGTHECTGAPSVTFGSGTVLSPGGQVNVVVRCTLNLVSLSFAGFAPTKVITAQASAPIDTYSVGG